MGSLSLPIWQFLTGCGGESRVYLASHVTKKRGKKKPQQPQQRRRRQFRFLIERKTLYLFTYSNQVANLPRSFHPKPKPHSPKPPDHTQHFLKLESSKPTCKAHISHYIHKLDRPKFSLSTTITTNDTKKPQRTQDLAAATDLSIPSNKST